MRKNLSRSLILLGLCIPLHLRAWGVPQGGGDFYENTQEKMLTTGSILVKGAWASASDSVTPLPEGGRTNNHVYTNPYLGLTYAFPTDWIEKYSGPPPSDSGYYVLAQIRPGDTFKGTTRGAVLIAAQDLFFALAPARTALDLIKYTTDRLPEDYRLEQSPTPVTIAGRSFVRYDYGSSVAELHWHVLATQIRCHMVQFVFTSRDSKMMENLIQEMDKMSLAAETGSTSGTGGGDVPACIRDYASGGNVVERVDPAFTERRFNPVPVRIVIDKEGKVKHIHFLSAFPEQAKAISDALSQWRFVPYLREGRPLEVETGIMFGRGPRPAATPSTNAAEE